LAPEGRFAGSFVAEYRALQGLLDIALERGHRPHQLPQLLFLSTCLRIHPHRTEQQAMTGDADQREDRHRDQHFQQGETACTLPRHGAALTKPMSSVPPSSLSNSVTRT